MALWTSLVKPVADMFTKGLDVVDNIVEDKDLANKLKTELRSKVLDIASNEFTTLLQSQSNIIMSEAKGDGWLQRNWRPFTMATFVTIIANNYIVAPYLGLIFGADYAIMLEIPPDMWGLLKMGLSGYVVGRSMEKIASGDGLKSVAKKILG